MQPVTQVDHVAAKRPLNADMMGVLKGSNAIIRTSPRSRRRRLNTGKFAKNIDVTLAPTRPQFDTLGLGLARQLVGEAARSPSFSGSLPDFADGAEPRQECWKVGNSKVPPRHGPNLRDEGSALEPLLGLGKRKAKGAGD